MYTHIVEGRAAQRAAHGRAPPLRLSGRMLQYNTIKSLYYSINIINIINIQYSYNILTYM